MARTILIHLNVEVPDSDTRNVEQIVDAVLDAIEFDAKTADDIGGPYTCALAEEV